MHEWHTNTSKNPLRLISELMGFEFDTDYGGRQEVSKVVTTSKMFPSHEDALNFVTRSSYGGNTAYMAAYTTKKLSKAYQNAFTAFLSKYNEYLDFKKNLTISYGRKTSGIKVLCVSFAITTIVKSTSLATLCTTTSIKAWQKYQCQRRWTPKQFFGT